MKSLVRIAALIALLGVQQLLAPLSVGAQVPDPCKPVPVPGLCNQPSPDPVPSPPGTKPKPKPGGGGGGGGQTGGGQNGGGGAQRPGKAGQPGQKGGGQKAAKAPFTVSGPNSTARLIEALDPLVRRGQPLKQLLLDVVGPFPVAGPAWWTNDWHACRDGCRRFHKGLDIFAPVGTPLVATTDGILTQKGSGGLAGMYVQITDGRGVEYFYAHLSGFADGVKVGDRVKVGQVVGYVGNSGNAINTPSHVHFEYQPGGVPQPPKPHVDRWLKIAERKARSLLGDAGIEVPAEAQQEEVLQYRLTRLFDLAGGGGRAQPLTDELLLLAGMQPAASSLDVARRTLGDMAWEIDWGGHVNGQVAGLVEDYKHHVVAEHVMGLQPWPFAHATPAGGTPDGHD